MKKNQGRKDRRHAAKKNRTFRGAIRMRLDNWKRHFQSIRRRNEKEHRAWVGELAKLHLYGNQRYERVGPVTFVNDTLGSAEDVRNDYPN